MNMEVVPTDVTHDLFSGSTGIHVNVDASKRDVGLVTVSISSDK